MSVRNFSQVIPFSSRIVSRSLMALAFILLGLFLEQRVAASAQLAFEDVVIRPPFRNALISDPVFMRRGGARVILCAGDEKLLLGVAKVLAQPGESTDELTRKGEIWARAALLEFSNGAEISRHRGQKESTGRLPGDKTTLSVSSFFDIVQSKVKGKIRQLPVVGTWWSRGFKFFYVAVGAAVDRSGRDISGSLQSGPNSDTDGNLNIQGEEPFVFLLRTSPVLCSSGGFRGFLWNGKRVLIFVGSALLKDSLPHAIRQAQLKAVRSMLGHEQGIEVLSVEYLSDQELFRVSDRGTQRMLLSNFLSIQKEKVSGFVRALPMVAYWFDKEKKICHVAIGKVFYE